MILSKVKFNIKIGKHLVFSLMMVSLRVFLKEKSSGVYLRLCSQSIIKFFAEIVNVFQPLAIFVKKLRHSCLT